MAIGEATLTPAAVAMIGDLFRPRQRSLASGLYYLGIPLGASFSLIVANLLWPIPWIGWRGCFLFLGLLGLSMVVVLMFIKDPRRGAMDDAPAFPSEQPAEPRLGIAPLVEIFRTLGRSPALGLTMLGAVSINISRRYHLARLVLAVRGAGLLESRVPRSSWACASSSAARSGTSSAAGLATDSIGVVSGGGCSP